MNSLNPLNALLSIVDPKYPNTIPIDEIVKNKTLLKSAIDLAERNGLYYYFIYKLRKMDIYLSYLSSEDCRWSAENKKLLEFKKCLVLLNKISKNYNIDYVVIKACNTIPHIPRDIDIFVHNKDRIKMIDALQDEGMKCVQDSIGETSLKCNCMKIDIYTEICYIGIDFMDRDFLLQSGVEDKLFGIKYFGLNNEANLLLLLIHSSFGHRSISLLDLLHIMHIRDMVDMNICREYADKRGWKFAFDLVLGELDKLYERVYKMNDIISFPYLSDKKIILKSISNIEGFDMDKYAHIFLHATLIQDTIIHKLKYTPIYNLLKSFESIRNIANSTTAYTKIMRGDKKSIDRKVTNVKKE